MEETYETLIGSIEGNKNIEKADKEKLLVEVKRMKYAAKRKEIKEILERFIDAFDKERYEITQEMMFESTAGDGWGSDNMTLKYRKTEFGYEDIFSAIQDLEEDYIELEALNEKEKKKIDIETFFGKEN